MHQQNAMPMREPISVYVIEASPIRRLGLKLCLERDARLRVVGEAETGAAAADDAARLKPDVVVVALALPESNPDSEAAITDAITSMKQRTELVVVALVASDGGEASDRARQAGADVCLPNTVSTANLCQLIVTLSDARNSDAAQLGLPLGRDHLAPGNIHSAKNRPGESAGKSLTKRELQVFHLLALGASNPQIARRLVLSPDTAKAHVKSVMRKLQVSERLHVLAEAMRLGLLE